MGCKETKMYGSGGSTDVAFGGGVHVGRAGNVDLTGRKMDFLGIKMVNMIIEDELHRTATSLTLTDNKLYAIGKELSLLPMLEEIDMDKNSFQRLPESLLQLPNLWRINASSNPLDPLKGFDVAPRLAALRSLALKNCSFLTFPSRILECANLEVLDISGNPDMHLSQVNFSTLSNLKTLRIANCGLTGDVLPAGIRRLKVLRVLDISKNKFVYANDGFFGPNIPLTLEELHIRAMHLTAVPPIVVLLKRLSFLNLSENPIETLDVLAGRVVKRLPRVSSGGTVSSTASPAPLMHTHKITTAAPNATAEAQAGSDVGSPTVRAPTAGVKDETGSAHSDGRASTTSRISMSKLSKAGMIAHVSHPLPIKKLSLRGCGLKTVPKYFHKLSNLEELDISDNEELDDPNMTLFSLQKLRKLNIMGCPFAVDPTTSRSEWFDIAKLNNLRDLQWELWRGTHNTSPYRTRIPLEICGLRLERINELELRQDLFVGDTVVTATNLLRDGYFKVDLCIDDDTLLSYIDAINIFLEGQKFFFPDDVYAPAVGAGGGPAAAAGNAKPSNGSGKCGAAKAVVSGIQLGELHLRISVHRYVFFLAMQAANYDATIVPPLDVMIIHYSQMTTNPIQYRLDCESVCGRILNCNYKPYFLELVRNPAATKDAVAASKRVWNLMVRSAQRDLAWLRYDFWEKRAKELSTAPAAAPAAAGAAGSPTLRRGKVGSPKGAPAFQRPHTSGAQLLPQRIPGETTDAVLASYVELCNIDSAHDLDGVLDQSITSHFLEQGGQVFKNAIDEFYRMNSRFVEHEQTLRELTLDWNRYVKYAALYAYHVMLRKSGGTASNSPVAPPGNGYTSPFNRNDHPIPSLLGPHYDAMENISFCGPDKYLPRPGVLSQQLQAPQRISSGLARRSSSGLSKQAKLTIRQRAIQDMHGYPVPTIGLTLLLYAHRTSHVKYFQMLTLLGIEDCDITWDRSNDIINETKRAWMALYNEIYVGSSSAYIFDCNDGVINPVTQDPDNAQLLISFNPSMFLTDSSYDKAVKPKMSNMRKRKLERQSKEVVLCSGDIEYGVF